MKGLSIYNEGSRCYQPCSYTPSNKSFCARLRRIFKGPPQEAPQPAWKDEKKYHHVPTHARSSFMKTATSPVMLGPHLRQPSETSTIDEKAAERQDRATQESLI